MVRLAVFVALIACVACLPQTAIPTEMLQEESPLKPVTDAAAPAVAAPAPKPAEAAPKAPEAAPASDKFTLVQGADCKNRMDITSASFEKSTVAECKARCESDSACTGYLIDETRACTTLKGNCDQTTGTKASLYIAKPQAPTTVANVQSSTSAPDDAMLNITLVIPTVRRWQSDGSPAPERYLAPMVHKLVGDLTPAQQKNVNILILNADKEPEKHEEALSLATLPNVQVISRPNRQQQMDATIKQTGAIKENGEVYLEDGRQVNKEWISWVAAEDLDGAYLLELGMKKTPYVLFLEDDVWPTTKALSKLTHFVHDLKTDDWLFVDLYTPNLNWAAGMLDVKNGDKYAFECCTQSMLFRSDRLPGIISYWREHAHEPVDDNLRNYRKNVVPNQFIYAARPNLFEHIGAYSSNPQKSKGIVEHQSIEFVPLML